MEQRNRVVDLEVSRARPLEVGSRGGGTRRARRRRTWTEDRVASGAEEPNGQELDGCVKLCRVLASLEMEGPCKRLHAGNEVDARDWPFTSALDLACLSGHGLVLLISLTSWLQAKCAAVFN